MMKRIFFSASTLILFGAATLAAQRPLKVYISADMEGITGVASADQLSPTSFEYGRARDSIARPSRLVIVAVA